MSWEIAEAVCDTWDELETVSGAQAVSWSELEEDRLLKERLLVRYHEARAEGDIGKARMLRQMLSEAWERQRTTSLSLNGRAYGRSLNNFTGWSNIKGQVQGSGNREFSTDWLADDLSNGADETQVKPSELVRHALSLCSDRQQKYIFAYFWEKKNSAEISEQYGVAPSTVCRTIARGVDNIKKYISDIVMVATKANEKNELDHDALLMFAEKKLSPRRCEVLKALMDTGSVSEAAKRLQVNGSTVSRLFKRIAGELRLHGVDVTRRRNGGQITAKIFYDLSGLKSSTGAVISLCSLRR